eukprot:CAMPEP_0174307400 /NCGR_PEP_ID=MMETSP0810-20121108/1094_1 /TAXON_ID=73025 ORGANISM="Eutreptiella gymnastica-like, Strain CCMP1594" /NCGR_SAMPLE_ID=MMETSP0810 /ASSEMBLY_ACC=CAM_ASM_000659 /LENGTH=87 /DNA_ID=CAMNT_0015414439 /DNA_START=900 /DNA_END=1163 /DNA_ORIENTATION=-
MAVRAIMHAALTLGGLLYSYLEFMIKQTVQPGHSRSWGLDMPCLGPNPSLRLALGPSQAVETKTAAEGSEPLQLATNTPLKGDTKLD